LLALVDVFVLVARELEPWSRLVALAGGAEAVRAIFARPAWMKRLEADGSQQALELLQIERQVGAGLLEELRKGDRWEAEAISAHDGRPITPTPATWHVAGLDFDPQAGTVLRDGAPWLLGMMLRLRAPSSVAAQRPVPARKPRARLRKVFGPVKAAVLADIEGGLKAKKFRKAGLRADLAPGRPSLDWLQKHKGWGPRIYDCGRTIFEEALKEIADAMA
jgi:hypothetical protein